MQNDEREREKERERKTEKRERERDSVVSRSADRPRWLSIVVSVWCVCAGTVLMCAVCALRTYSSYVYSTYIMRAVCAGIC